MRTLLFSLAAVLTLLFACPAFAQVGTGPGTDAATAKNRTVPTVLVELFTSENCASCPPADRQIEFLDKHQPVATAEVITLSYHVDYPDGFGWKDRFASPLFTQRQEQYVRQFRLASAYTPQLVVAGRKVVIVTDFNRTNLAIMEAANSPAGKIATTLENGRVKIQISGLPRHELATVYLAAAEDDLSSKVGGGENNGIKLRHMSVVRELRPIGTVARGQSDLSLEAELPLGPEWKRENVKYVVFVQDNLNRKILAVDQIRPPAPTSDDRMG